MCYIYIALQISPILTPTPTSIVKARGRHIIFDNAKITCGPGGRQIVLSPNAKSGKLRERTKQSFLKEYEEYCGYELLVLFYIMLLQLT